MKLKSFQIGDVRIASPVVLAALAGYSDLPYRLICREHGAPYCASEVMLDKQMLVPGKLRRRLVHLGDADHPVAGQIMGNDPATVAAAARELCAVGFDVVDLNFACPVKKVLSRGRGGALMKDPARAVSIVQAVAAVIDRPLTLKLRRSFHAADRDNDAFRQIADGAWQAGVAAICVHGRSVDQRYTGRADWDFIAAVKAGYPERTIVGSGDVMTPADALAMLDHCGVDGVAAARGAIGNPWFFRQVRDLAAGREPYQPTLAEQRDVLARHFAGACEIYGRRAPTIMRKFGIKYGRMHPAPRRVREAFVSVKNARQWRAVLDELYPQAETLDATPA